MTRCLLFFKEHDWVDDISGCSKCKRCGKKRQHEFEPVEGKCYTQCIHCSIRRDVPHEWDGCICLECGAKRNEGHRWKKILKKPEYNFICYYEECTICGVQVQTKHKMDACRCVLCGKAFDWGRHDFVPVAKTCTEKCRICGKVEEGSWSLHVWEAIPEKCEPKCKVCGRNGHPEHTWDKSCKCSVCGETRDDYHSFGRSCVCAVCGRVAPPDYAAHKWENNVNCRKRCAVCGKTAYNHKYKVTGYWYAKGEDNQNDYTDYQCSVCGHRAHVAYGFEQYQEGFC